MKIKKGDNVKILTGKDRGKSGKVVNVDFKSNKATVEGLNIFKKHVRPKRQGEKGEVVQVFRPLAVSNLMIVCPACGKATRIGYAVDKEKKTRICKKCHAPI
ncbi:MAG: Ribosomal protein L24 [Candidatus Jorgensenbacteria bacterium GW2011_GWA1_48_11]|uniref:Large ribosomal subunit protein uL24 n=1 Tax=Candidatus Jorgensenbacteria bacterium GW2011_GWA1_48_11 TaxID=1618660 RepID=A0A0G1U9R4_9BACT|nr:MAG: Ribosomal protein L24 [Candidatus Jorgensenbacteria bacterium GW2011_GWA1_48_11]KKW12367.1 MAG: Ribosomal protein L24 [Candidatus Jorgensenbacteria bacterium GW2011_GWB1_49_9]